MPAWISGRESCITDTLPWASLRLSYSHRLPMSLKVNYDHHTHHSQDAFLPRFSVLASELPS